MIEVKELKKKFIKLDKNKKKVEFYAVNGVSFEAKERRNYWDTSDLMGQGKQHYSGCLLELWNRQAEM